MLNLLSNTAQAHLLKFRREGYPEIIKIKQVVNPFPNRLNISRRDWVLEGKTNYKGHHHHQTTNETESYLFIVITKSAPSSLDDREIMRHRGWLSYDWKDVHNRDIKWRHFFLVGLTMDPEWSREKMAEENAKYGDILVSPTFDSYRRMTYKLMWSFQHLIDHYDFKFLVVLAEDSVVNIRDLNTYFERKVTEESDRKFFGGPECTIRSAHRKGKAALSLDVWPSELLPRLCIGSGIMFSRDVLEELLVIWDEDPQPVNPLDDVQIAVMIFQSGSIPIQEIEEVSHGCRAKDPTSFIVTQIKPMDKTVDMIESYVKYGYYCAERVKAHRVHVPGEDEIMWT